MTLANIASAKKRAHQSEKRRQRNASDRSLLRTSIKRVTSAIEARDKEGALAALKSALPVIDRMAQKGIIHKNKAARHKHQLNELLRSLQ
jgi:small subunit ribosomal protein S20